MFLLLALIAGPLGLESWLAAAQIAGMVFCAH